MDIQLKKKHPVVKYKYYILTGLAVIALVIYLMVSMGGPSKLRYDAENLQIVEVKRDKFMEYIDLEGIAQPKMTIKINSLESGTVDSIVAEEGSVLKQGDIILILKNAELQRAIEDERDDLNKKRINYEEKLLQMERQSSELRRNIMRNVYDLERMNKQYVLDKEEYQMGIKSKAELDIASDEFNFQQTNAEMMLSELKNDSLRNAIQIGLMKNDMEREEVRYKRSRERLDQLIVRAPIDGQLSFISAVYGEKIGSGSSIGEQKVIHDLKINTKISEYYIDRVSIGLPATVTYLNKKYQLKITKLNPEIKERMFEIDLVFIGERPDNLRIGKTYRVQIELGQPEDALIVEKGSFYQSTGGQWIFKLDKSGNKAVKTNITVGRQNPGQYEVLEGLSVGDKVIVSGYNNFGDAQELVLKY
ncbi:MAG: HlyD family efflux transporter periplasmic adaptor subunit [Prevotellaceae bacterium]|jgi:multidrug efflux pump subunit AcrA (membrane-fusion protein)|nr:HlyD family efflux transporter periplasmic adaptor subunit [Prevotellaceae bacterium]